MAPSAFTRCFLQRYSKRLLVAACQLGLPLAASFFFDRTQVAPEKRWCGKRNRLLHIHEDGALLKAAVSHSLRTGLSVAMLPHEIRARTDGASAIFPFCGVEKLRGPSDTGVVSEHITNLILRCRVSFLKFLGAFERRANCH